MSTAYCVDFDDLCDVVATPSLELLCELKHTTPSFQCTLFTIPLRTSDATIAKYKEVGEGWIHLAPHGYRHTKGECLAWSDEEAVWKINAARDRGIYAPIFKAPAWLLDADVYAACKTLNYAVASHRLYRIPNTGVSEYIYNRGMKGVTSTHGHLTNCMDNFILTMRGDGRLTFPPNALFTTPMEAACPQNFAS